MIQIKYDKQGDVLEIKFSDMKVADSEYNEETGLVADYDSAGKLVGIEVISFSKRVKNASEIESLAI